MGKTGFYAYFVNSERDKKTGLYVENVGNSFVPAGEEYPLKSHPDTHYFRWDNGRFLKEYQMLYISQGKGVFESRQGGKSNLSAGSVFLLYPNEWHRYRPLKTAGWEEYWVGFNGKFAEKMVNNSIFSIKKPVIFMKNNLVMESLFQEIISFGKEERPGYQQVISGLIMQILGQIQLSVRSKNIIGKPIEEKIIKARVFMNQKANTQVDLTNIARELNLSYSLFRKRFKEYTGVSPKQYFLHLKIKRAQNLLLNTTMPIQTIAYEAGFENIYYFSKAFKEKTGLSPSDFRRNETK